MTGQNRTRINNNYTDF